MADSTVDSWLSELDQAIAESVNTASSGALLVLRSALEERRGQEGFTNYSIHQTTTSPVIPLPSWVPRPVAEFAGWRCELRPVPVLVQEAIATPMDTENLIGLAEAIRRVPHDLPAAVTRRAEDVSHPSTGQDAPCGTSGPAPSGTQHFDIRSQSSTSSRKRRLAELKRQLAEAQEQRILAEIEAVEAEEDDDVSDSVGQRLDRLHIGGLHQDVPASTEEAPMQHGNPQ